MKTLKFIEYKVLNENLNQGFLEPTKENIESFNLDYDLVEHNPDGSINYDGNVELDGIGYTRIPFNFYQVFGSFDCSDNLIKTLHGSPKIMAGDFKCFNNQLTNLKEGPIETLSYDGNFYCNYNNIIILDDYSRNYTFKPVTDNPIVINKTDIYISPIDWSSAKIQKRFKDGLPDTWNEIENQEDFGRILEKIIELEIEMYYPEEIIKYSNKFNFPLLKYLSPNVIKALKTQADTAGNIGFNF